MLTVMLLSLLVLGAVMFRIQNVASAKLFIITLFFITTGFSTKVAVADLPLLSQAVIWVPIMSGTLLLMVRTVPAHIVISLSMIVAFFAGALMAGTLSSGPAAATELLYTLLFSGIALSLGMEIREWLLSRQMMKRCHEFKDCTECEMFLAHGGS